MCKKFDELMEENYKLKEAQETGPLKGEFAAVAEQAFREQYGLEEAQGAQAVEFQQLLLDTCFESVH